MHGPSFDKLLKRLPNQDRKRIEDHFEDSRFDPYSGDIRKLKGSETWAKRIGEYRVFYEVNQPARLVEVFYIERRTTQTYRKGKHK